MANEIRTGSCSGLALYAVLVSPTGQLFNGATPGFEGYNAANWPSYAIALAEQGASGIYLASVPAGVAAGLLMAPVYLRSGAAPAVAADVQLDAPQPIAWAGSALGPVQTGDAYARLGAGGAGLTAAPYTGPTAGTIQAGLATASGLTGLAAAVAGVPAAVVAAQPASGLATGTIVVGSTPSAVVVSGLTAGLNFVGQLLALAGGLGVQRGEVRVIGTQSSASGNYTFSTIPFSGGAVVAGETVMLG